MTIQGSTEVFPPAAMLRFLATTRRTGRFTIEHPGGTGTALLRNGRIGTVTVDAATGGSGPDLFGSLTEMLKVRTGRFSFAPLVINGAGEGLETEPLVRRAEAAGADQRKRTKPLPAADTMVTLSADVAFRHLRVDELDWAIVVAVGDGSPVAAIANHVEHEVAEVVGRLIKLAESGVVVLAVAPTREHVAVDPSVDPASVDPAGGARG
jgi:hypothetical protein